MLVRLGSHGARPAHGHGHRQELGRGGTRRHRRRRLVWLRRQLHEATDLFDQGSDDGDLVEQITHRQVLEAMTLHLLAQALGLDIETIIACLQGAHDGGGRGFGAVPASAAAVAGLEKQAFHGTEGCGGGGESECAICFEDFEDGEEVSVMPCSHGHEFHPICITKWLGRSNMCPLCRHQLPTGNCRHQLMNPLQAFACVVVALAGGYAQQDGAASSQAPALRFHPHASDASTS